MSRLSSIKDSIKEKKEIQKGREAKLEKDDFKALNIAAFQVFGPVLIGSIIFFALIILIITLIW